jgi:hypothetical protein
MKPVHIVMTLFLAGLALCLYMMWGGAKAYAHSWYPQQCCSDQDCEPIPDEGVKQTAAGFHVKYVSPRFGAIDEVIPLADAKPSRDGNFHGCWRKSVDTYYAPKKWICFFAPMAV